MNSKKAIIILIAASVLVAAVAGIAFAQYAGAQTNGANNSATQTAQGTTSASNAYPQQGYHPYGSTQNGYPYGCGRGTGMCGRFW